MVSTFENSLIPSASDILLARESSRLLGGLKLNKSGSVGLQIEGKQVKLPAALARVLMGALDRLAEGKGLAVVPLDDEISTQEAADLLNVSRPFVIKLLDGGEIPSRKVGRHRRVLVADVLAYKEKNDAGRRKALAELVAQAQELKMGY